jgi:hypothetical protein
MNYTRYIILNTLLWGLVVFFILSYKFQQDQIENLTKQNQELTSKISIVVKIGKTEKDLLEWRLRHSEMQTMYYINMYKRDTGKDVSRIK